MPVSQDSGILLASLVVFSTIDTNLKFIATKSKTSETLSLGIDETGRIFLKSTAKF